MAFFSSARARIVEALFPQLCAGCRTEIAREHVLCSTCASALKPRYTSEKYARSPLVAVHFLFLYKTSPIRGILHAFKYAYVTEIRGLLWQTLARERRVLARMRSDMIVPLPLHPRRLRTRGFNQSEIIAAKLAELLAVPLETRILTRKRNTPFQLKARNRLARMRNVRNAFAVSDPNRVRGKDILLVDDVITTGATLTEAARTLRAAGARRVEAFVLAKD
jgi:ComF family protein